MESGMYTAVGAIIGAIITSGANLLSIFKQTKQNQSKKELRKLQIELLESSGYLLLLLAKEKAYVGELRKRRYPGQEIGIRREFTAKIKKADPVLAKYGTISEFKLQKKIHDLEVSLLSEKL